MITVRSRIQATCLILCCNAGAVNAAEPDFLRALQQATQTMYEKAVVPQLIEHMTPEERERLGTLSVTVIPSRDPLRVELEPLAAGTSRLVVSTGFILIQDMLIDASVLAVVTDHEAQLLEYAPEVTRFALKARYAEKNVPPRPFWTVMGWNEQRYGEFRKDPRYSVIRSRATIQTLAWTLARAAAERLVVPDRNLGKTGQIEDTEYQIQRKAADMLLRAGITPMPATGAAVLYYGIQYPTDDSQPKWLCATGGMTRAAMQAVSEREQKKAPADPVAAKARLAEWGRGAEAIEQAGHCKR